MIIIAPPKLMVAKDFCKVLHKISVHFIGLINRLNLCLWKQKLINYEYQYSISNSISVKVSYHGQYVW